MGNFGVNVAIPFILSDFKEKILCDFVMGKERQQKDRYFL